MSMTLSQSQMPTPTQILDVTRDVLSRPEFRPASAWQQWVADLGRQAEQLLKDGVLWLQAHPTLQWLIFVVLSLLLVALLVHLVRTVWAETRLHTQARSSPPEAGTSDARSPALPDWSVVQRDIRDALQQGDMYLAVRRLHRYFLLLLDSRNLLLFTRWKTNADYLRECPTAHPSFAVLTRMSQLYERIVYAHREVPLQTFTALLTQVEHDQNRPQS